MDYRVTWTIDIEARSPKEAARTALEIHRDPSSLATHFTVADANGKSQEIDLPPGTVLLHSRTIHVLIPMDDGNVRDVKAFKTEEAAQRAEKEWLAEHELTSEQDREHASDWGTGIAIWECDMND